MLVLSCLSGLHIASSAIKVLIFIVTYCDSLPGLLFRFNNKQGNQKTLDVPFLKVKTNLKTKGKTESLCLLPCTVCKINLSIRLYRQKVILNKLLLYKIYKANVLELQFQIINQHLAVKKQFLYYAVFLPSAQTGSLH